jgi:hypothetical protein
MLSLPPDMRRSIKFVYWLWQEIVCVALLPQMVAFAQAR